MEGIGGTWPEANKEERRERRRNKTHNKGRDERETYIHTEGDV